MEVRAVSYSAEALNVRPAVTLLRSCAAGVGVTIAAGEPDVVEGMRGERKVMDEATFVTKGAPSAVPGKMPTQRRSPRKRSELSRVRRCRRC